MTIAFGSIILYICMWLASLCFLTGAVYFAVAREPRLGKHTLTVSRLLPVSGFLLGAVFCMRYCVGMYMNAYSTDPDYVKLTWLEEIGNSIVHSLQTFSMDEDYTLYIQQSKNLIRDLGSNCFWPEFLGFITAAVSVAAPIVGGALLLEILANLLPGLQLLWANAKVWRPKYYFSELNAHSLVLAKSFREIAHDADPIFVFANSGGNEDLRKSAKRLGAVCMDSDLEHIKKCRMGHRSYFLLSEDENENLRTLAGISQKSCGGFLTCANIYLFTVSDAYIQAENKMYENLTRWGMPKEKQPLLYPVRTAHNMISRLLVDVPLYEPLVHKVCAGSRNPHLKLTILGGGTYGMEMLLSAYSFGQMLNTTLEITVVSREPEEDFWNRLYVTSPELMATTQRGHEILRYNEKGDCSDPYCSVSYISCDIHSRQFVRLLTEKVDGKTLRDTGYFLISLGDDSSNISASELLIRHIGTWHLHDRDARTVIACTVKADDLAQLLGEGHKAHESIYLHVIGSQNDVYSADNVLMLSHAKAGDSKHQSYKRHNRDDLMKKQSKRQKDAYSFYSSMAKGMHRKYRVFSAGLLLEKPLITESVFTTEGHRSARYLKSHEIADVAYMKLLGNNGKQTLTPEEAAAHAEIMHRLAWLEHRRWNAYIRASGFRHTDRYTVYANVSGTHKNLRLKLHPCLVECNTDGILGHIYPDGKVEEKTLIKASQQDPAWVEAFGSRELDLLDALSFDLYRRKLNSYDFKFYDYPDDHLDGNGNLLPEAGGVPKPAADTQQTPKDRKKNQINKRKERRATETTRDGSLSYEPKHQKLSEIQLPADCNVEQAAKAIHEKWMAGRLADGWTLGDRRDDGLRTTPCLVPYEQLPESEKAYDRATVEQTTKTLISLGFALVPKDGGESEEITADQLEALAESVHDRWAYERLREGWVWGEIRNDQEKTTPCLIPYAALPEEEKAYDRSTAQQTVEALRQQYAIRRNKQ